MIRLHSTARSRLSARSLKGRGEGAHLTCSAKGAEQDQEHVMAGATCLDVGPFMQHKIEAIAANRSQFPIQPHMLLHTILQELMGQEYFVRVSPCVAVEPAFAALQTTSCREPANRVE